MAECGNKGVFTKYLLSWTIHGYFESPSNPLLGTASHCTPITRGLSSCQEQKSVALLTRTSEWRSTNLLCSTCIV